MVLVYGDDIFCIQKDALVVIDALEIIYVMKHLGENIEKVQTQDSKFMWATHSGDYCKAETANLEKTLTADGKNLLK